jgi:hypothetical protein
VLIFGLGKHGADHIEVEIVDAIDVLAGVDDAQRGVDPDLLQRVDVGQGDDLVARVVAKDLDGELVALVIDHLAVADLPARLCEELHRLLEMGPLRLRRIVDGQFVLLGEDFGRQLVLVLVENLQFLALRQAAGSELAADEEAVRALVGVEEGRPV